MSTMLKKLSPSPSSVGVLGAGISGLSYAFFLNKLRPDVNITILEKSSGSGGYIHSKTIKTEEFDSRVSVDSTVLEKGPRTLRSANPGSLLIIDILHKLNHKQDILGLHKSSDANKRYLLSPYTDTQGNSGKLSQVPNDLISFWKFMFDPLTRGLWFALLKEPFVKKHKLTPGVDETIEQFFTRRFNKKLSDNIVSAITHGIYAGDAAKLSMKSIFPSIVQLEQEHGSIVKYGIVSMFNNFKTFVTELFSRAAKEKNEREYASKSIVSTDEKLTKYQQLLKPSFNFLKTSIFLKNFPIISINQGLQNLTTWLTEYLLKQENIKFVFNSQIKGLSLSQDKILVEVEDSKPLEFDHVRSTINSHSLANLISESTTLSEKLNTISYTSIVLANVYIPHLSVKPMEGFGYLVPKSMTDTSEVIGVIFDSDVERNSKKLFFYNDVDVALSDLSTNIDSSDLNYLNSLSKTVARRGLVVTNEYTKLTFMIGGHLFKDLDDLPTNSRIQKTIRDVMEVKLKIKLNNINDIQTDMTTIINCIPQYESGFSELTQEIRTLVSKEFDGRLSLGGMAFSKGVGVPDVVMSSWSDALEICDK